MRPGLFDPMHVYLGQIMMVFMVIIACLAWLKTCAAVPDDNLPAAFLIRVVAFSSLPFILWLYLHRTYVALVDSVVIYFFSLVDFILFIPLRPEIYSHTFDLIVFGGLVAATKSVTSRRKMIYFIAGIAVMTVTHVLMRVNNVLITALHVQSTTTTHFFLFFHLFNQYLLPVLLWLAMVSHAKLRRESLLRPSV